jgi:hypothetical protein
MARGIVSGKFFKARMIDPIVCPRQEDRPGAVQTIGRMAFQKYKSPVNDGGIIYQYGPNYPPSKVTPRVDLLW